MTRILSGLLLVTMLVVSVGGATLALFSDQSDIKGLTVSAGNANIQLGYTNAPNSHVFLPGDLDFGGSPFEGPLYPGYHAGVVTNLDAKDLWVANVSAAPVALNLSMKLTTLPTNWGNQLSYAIEVLVKDENSGLNTGWITMTRWDDAYVDLPGGSLASGTSRRFFIFTRVPFHYGDNDSSYAGGPTLGSDIGNEIANQTLSGGAFTVLGEQVP